MQRMIYPNKKLMPEIESLLNEGRKITLKVKGNSMFPFIKGDRDRVELHKPQSLKMGDIVLARLQDEQYVIHRIIDLTNEEVLLMGDGNLYKMEMCHRTDVIGKAFRIIRGKRSIYCSYCIEKIKAKVWRKLLPIRKYMLFICKIISIK